MVSPHLLRPFSARQLSLVAGDDRVVVFSIMGDRWVGPSALAHGPTLGRRIAELSSEIELVAFIDEPIPEPVTVSLVDDMVTAMPEGVDALARPVVLTEALKRVVNGRVVESIDRSCLFTLRCPEVIRRRALETASSRIGERLWVNPTSLVAECGGSVAFFEAGAGAREGSIRPA